MRAKQGIGIRMGHIHIEQKISDNSKRPERRARCMRIAQRTRPNKNQTTSFIRIAFIYLKRANAHCEFHTI